MAEAHQKRHKGEQEADPGDERRHVAVPRVMDTTGKEPLERKTLFRMPRAENPWLLKPGDLFEDQCFAILRPCLRDSRIEIHETIQHAHIVQIPYIGLLTRPGPERRVMRS